MEYSYTEVILSLEVGTNKVIVMDTNYKAMFVGEQRTMGDYESEVLEEENECAEVLDIFTHHSTRHSVIVWYDSETAETFITFKAKEN